MGETGTPMVCATRYCVRYSPSLLVPPSCGDPAPPCHSPPQTSLSIVARQLVKRLVFHNLWLTMHHENRKGGNRTLTDGRTFRTIRAS
jgi:hypothetical protein